MQIKSYRLLLILSFLLVTTIAFSQFNVKTGMSVGWINPQNTNNLLKKFNDEHAFLTKHFSPIHLAYGLVLGARYRWKFVDLEFSYHIKMRKAKTKGKYQDTNTNYSREILMGINTFSLGLGTHFNDFGFGASMDLSKLIISGRNDAKKRKDKYPLVNESFFSNHFYLSYELNSNNVLSISLRPYVQIPWERFNINALRAPLEQGASTGNDMDDFTNFGLMVIFYNGEKN